MLTLFQRILAVIAVAVAMPALAQFDPPARVGRISFLENQVFFRVDRNDQGGPATLNWPISSGAQVETGQHGRAEMWIGSTAYRLADNSQIEFMAVDDSRVDLRMNGGSLSVSILDRDQVDDLIVSTPDGNVRFVTPGRYRIDVYSDHSEVSAQAGQAVFEDRGRAMPVAAGQKASRWSNGSERLDGAWNQDGFDRWVANRENLTLASVSRRYVSPGMTGYQDLDAYGDWQSAPDYGSVWYPRAVAADWAPYRDGRWAWVAPWGWTWIDQAPWGFAPFHYGRWAMIQGRWGWVPGRPVPRPVYAPALVGWIGNPGWSVSFRTGSAPAVGWFPLAPREVYVPGYRYSSNYVRQINIGHVRDVGMIERAERGGPREPFVHNASPRAVTVVPANLMREGRPIGGDFRLHDRAELGRSPVASRAPNADWLPPAPSATRSHGDNHREGFARPPRSESAAGSPNQPGFRQPMPDSASGRPGEPRREVMRGSPETRQGFDNRGRPADATQPTPSMPPQDVRPPMTDSNPAQANDARRGFNRRPGEFPPAAQTANPAANTVPMPNPMPQRDFNRRPDEARIEGGAPSRPQDARSDERPGRSMAAPQSVSQPPAPIQAPAPVRREMPDAPSQRQLLNQERTAPREAIAPPLIRQQEAPRPAPEVRAPVAQPAPTPVPQRVETPRPQTPQGGWQNEARPEAPQQRQFLHQERTAPREVVPPQIIRQPEMPRPSPEVRAPVAQPAPAPMPQRIEMPRPAPEIRAPAPAPVPAVQMQPQRVEPPRQQPAPQGGGQGDPRRRHGNEDERGGR